ncbi:XdhC family protein [Streptomyces sp. NBC_00343]|uniref:XdhC family protein n=1 Tax=Streptomyces sp. NBC_00343 TaxID=2975719 RepID=UPI002E29C0B4|nr:XdhC family protein [Streptomyces sp. NBC_00343]
MRDLLPVLGGWYAAGAPFGLATVVAVSRSAPRDPGAAMAVGPGDEVVGSVSGGCVEGAVFELAREVVASGEARLETFGYSDEDAFAVGLTCGGEITVLVRLVTPEVDPTFGAVARSVATGEPVTVATVVDGPGVRGAVLAVWAEGVGGGAGDLGGGGALGGGGTPGAFGAAGAIRTPGSRGAPGSPGDPGALDSSDALGAPGTPGASSVPGTLSTPSTAGSLGIPPAPGASGASDTPSAPGTPSALGTARPPGTPSTPGTLGPPGLDVAVAADARGELALGATGLRHYGPRGERREDSVAVFLHSFAPPPRMLVFGAIDHAAAVARIGDFLGYRVTVCDARPVFATPKRFPAGVEVVVDWPHRYLRGTDTDERTVICVLTHDPKFDVPLLEEALRRPAAYVGAMGSRRTHDYRMRRLLESGLSEGELARLRSPVGLDLGARTPEEVAVSVAAEIVALRWGGTGAPLTGAVGAIHRGPVR